MTTIAAVCISEPRSERRAQFSAAAAQNGLRFSYYDALTSADIVSARLPDGCAVEVSDLRWAGSLQNDPRRLFAPLLFTEIARAFSHVACWRSTLSSRIDYLAVFEDDAEVIRHLGPSELDGDFDLKFLADPGRSFEIGDRPMSGYLLSRSGIVKALRAFSRLSMPPDLQLLAHCDAGRQCYVPFAEALNGGRQSLMKAAVCQQPICRRANARHEHGSHDSVGTLPRNLPLQGEAVRRYLELAGVSIEPQRMWTDGPLAQISFALPDNAKGLVALTFGTFGFVWAERLPKQVVDVFLEGAPIAEWVYEDREPVERMLVVDIDQQPSRKISLSFAIRNPASPSSFGINTDARSLGVAFTHLCWDPVTDEQALQRRMLRHGRKVGTEARKSFDRKVRTGFWDRYVSGPNVLDIGFKGYEAGSPCLPILEGSIGIDIDYPGYDGRTLPFPDESQDAVYSSHCLEHIPDPINAIRDWWRVTKFGGHIITVVPSALLYERRRKPPSRWNADHRRFYTVESLAAEFGQALAPNTYRIRHLVENDEGYDYGLPPDRHPAGCYEIELVIQKIHPPEWQWED